MYCLNCGTCLDNKARFCSRCGTFVSSQRTHSPDIRDHFAKYGGIDAEMLTIDLMDGLDFEQWCADVLLDMGFEDVEVTPGSGDQGVDILAGKDGLRYAIQCKRYTSDLGNTPIQEVHAGKYLYRCHVAAVITNRYFTDGAKDLASATGVLLWDRDWILRYLQSKLDIDGSLRISHSDAYSFNGPDSCEVALYDDEMFPAAVEVILETRQASVSMLQRRLQLGYARAARIIDEMEEKGIVGPFRGSNPRSIYITKEQWAAMRSNGDDAFIVNATAIFAEEAEEHIPLPVSPPAPERKTWLQSLFGARNPKG